MSNKQTAAEKIHALADKFSPSMRLPLCAEGREIDPGAFLKRYGTASSGERRIMRFLLNVWLGHDPDPGIFDGIDLHFDMIDGAGGLDTHNRRVIADWFLNPVWP